MLQPYDARPTGASTKPLTKFSAVFWVERIRIWIALIFKVLVWRPVESKLKSQAGGFALIEKCRRLLLNPMPRERAR